MPTTFLSKLLAAIPVRAGSANPPADLIAGRDPPFGLAADTARVLEALAAKAAN